MNARGRNATRVLAIVTAMLSAAPVVAQNTEAYSGNLLGHRGILRMSSAANLPAGWIGIGTDFQYFTAGDFLSAGEEHARMVNTYSVVWAPFQYMEAALAMHVTSDQSTVADSDQLMVAVGDPELSLKGGAELAPGLALGGLFDLRFPSGAGFFEPSLSATSFLFAALGTYTVSPELPLSVHLNVGFAYDGTENLFDDPGELTVAQRYAAQLSSFHRVATRVGLEYATSYVGPFLEVSLEPYVGDGAPGFGDSPGILSFGARVWPTKSRSLQLLAAMDIGVTGVADGEPLIDDETPSDPTDDKFAYAIPRWNLVLRLSYRFDAYAEPEVRVVDSGGTAPGGAPEAPKTNPIAGTVVDAKSGEPIEGAQVAVQGQSVSGLAVDPRDGSFRTFEVPVGQHVIVATAPGYKRESLQVQVQEGSPASATIRMQPKTTVVPGTIRGTITALVGRNPKSTTVLIPALDKTIEVGRKGTFSVSLDPGSYKLVISARGFRTQTKTIRVREGETVILNVELHK